jgi:hypothetical protein
VRASTGAKLFDFAFPQVGLAESSLGDAKSSLGDAESSLGDAKSSLGDAKSLLGDAKSSLGDAKSLLGDAKSSLGDAKSSLGDVKSSLGDVYSGKTRTTPGTTFTVAAKGRRRARRTREGLGTTRPRLSRPRTYHLGLPAQAVGKVCVVPDSALPLLIRALRNQIRAPSGVPCDAVITRTASECQL